MQLIPLTIDLTYLYSLTDGDKSFEQILLKCTIEDVDSKIEGLQNGWKSKNITTIRENAHSLVSLSAIAGLPQVEKWSRIIDQKFADGFFHPELEEFVINIIAGWPVVKKELEVNLQDTLAFQ